MKRQTDAPAAEVTVIRKLEESLQLVSGPVKFTTLDWTGSTGSVFILGNLTHGVLGTSRLGSGNGALSTTVRIINNNNTFRDYFHISNFIDTTNSTGSWAYYPSASGFTGSFGYYTGSGQIFQSTLIYTNPTHTLGSVTINPTYIGSYTFYISGNSGSTWSTVVEDTQYSITGSELKFKAECTSVGSLTYYDITYTEI